MQATTPLNEVITTLRRKYGQKAIHFASQAKDTLQCLPTGVEVLDTLLEGGLVHQHITEYTGKPTSGATTCTYQTIASLQSQSYEIVYLDMPQTFDAMIATVCDVAVERILVVHPPTINHALELMRDIALNSVPCLMILDVFDKRMPSTISRLHLRLAQSPSLVLILSSHQTGSAEVSIHFKHLDWIYSKQEIVGYKVQATLLHHPRLTHHYTHFSLPLMGATHD